MSIGSLFIAAILLPGDEPGVRQGLNPIAEGMPAIQFVIFSRMIYSAQNFVVQHDGRSLIIAFGKKLKDGIPDFLFYSFFQTPHIAIAEFIQHINPWPCYFFVQVDFLCIFVFVVYDVADTSM